MKSGDKVTVPNFDAQAVVVDDHTGRELAHFQGLGAEEDAQHHVRTCSAGGVKHMSSVSVITGKEAAKVHKSGRV